MEVHSELYSPLDAERRGVICHGICCVVEKMKQRIGYEQEFDGDCIISERGELFFRFTEGMK